MGSPPVNRLANAQASGDTSAIVDLTNRIASQQAAAQPNPP
jgi:hypothetical protein